jgi:putative ABC transport system permease protein
VEPARAQGGVSHGCGGHHQALRPPTEAVDLRPPGLIRLALTGIASNPLRSWLVGGCALLVAGMVLCTVIISRGGEESLRLARERLGADVVVVPRGSVTGVEGALLLGNATNTYMPRGVVDSVAAVPGVATASPQLYLTSMANSSCCSVSLMFMFAFDPVTDFTIEPWLRDKLGHDLEEGQAIGGSDVFVPAGQDKIKLYGYDFDLVGNLEPTGTNLDQTLFMTFPTADAMAAASQTKAKMALPVLQDTVSSVLVKVDPGADRSEVAKAITAAVPEVQAVPAAEMFGSYGSQISGVLRTLVVIVALTVVLSLALMAVVFWMSVHDRRRQIGVLRALGATQRFVLSAYMTEAALLALVGGLAGAILAAAAMYLFRNLLVSALGFPILLPSPASLLGLVVAGLLIALAVAAVAAFVPALRASRQEPAVSMRE